MKTYTVPFEFSMDNCFWFGPEGTVINLSAEVELSEDEAAQLEGIVREKGGKRDTAVNEVCKKTSYRYALINEFTEGQVFYDDEEKMMAVFEQEGLFVYRPDEPGTDPDKRAEFSIWLEEYFFSLEDEQMVEFIEKYYGYTASRLTEEETAYRYSLSVPENI